MKTLESRVRAAWSERAFTAGLLVGTQTFVLGALVAQPIALSSAWLAAGAVLPAAAAAVALSRRAAGAYVRPGTHRIRLTLLSLLLLGCAALAAAALVCLAEQSLLPQARLSWNAAVTLSAVVLCACSGGVSRLCYALRWALPALIAVLTAVSMPMTAAGLFPILGAGALPVGVAALCMLAAATPALMLLLPPPALALAGEDAQRCPPPGTGFFLARVLPGALFGMLLLLAVSACNTYESISPVPGMRLRIVCSGHPRGGLPQTALTSAQLLCMLLLAAGLLSASGQALGHAWPRLCAARLALVPPALLLSAVMLLLTAFGPTPVLAAAPFMTLLALPLLMKPGDTRAKRRRGLGMKSPG